MTPGCQPSALPLQKPPCRTKSAPNEIHQVGDNWLEYVDVSVAGMPLRCLMNGGRVGWEWDFLHFSDDVVSFNSSFSSVSVLSFSSDLSLISFFLPSHIWHLIDVVWCDFVISWSFVRQTLPPPSHWSQASERLHNSDWRALVIRSWYWLLVARGY